jgi:hypothetical protein
MKGLSGEERPDTPVRQLTDQSGGGCHLHLTRFIADNTLEVMQNRAHMLMGTPIDPTGDKVRINQESFGGNNRSFGFMVFLSVFVIVEAVMAVVWQGNDGFGLIQPKAKVCTLEAKLCSDGSSVGRQGPDCEFAPCPSPAVPYPIVSISPAIQAQTDWKTFYSTTNYRYQVDYPASWKLEKGNMYNFVRFVNPESNEFIQIDCPSGSGKAETELPSPNDWEENGQGGSKVLYLSTEKINNMKAVQYVWGTETPETEEGILYTSLLSNAKPLVCEIYTFVTFDNSDYKNEISKLDIYNHILSTFQFTDSSEKEAPVGWRTFENKDYGFSIDYPGSWQAVTDKNYLFGYDLDGENPVYTLELQGKFDLLKEGGAPGLPMPVGYKKEYQSQGINAINPELIHIDIFKNDNNLSLTEYLKLKQSAVDTLSAVTEKMGNQSFVKVAYVGIHLYYDWYISKNGYIYRISQYIYNKTYDVSDFLINFRFIN